MKRGKKKIISFHLSRSGLSKALDLNLVHEAWPAMHSHGTYVKSHPQFPWINPSQDRGSMALFTLA